MAGSVAAVMVCLLVCLKLACTEIGYCFRLRNPIGERGKCYEIIHFTEEGQGTEAARLISSAEECCRQGGAGWAAKANGKRCADACREHSAGNGVGVQAPVAIDEEDKTGTNEETNKEGEEIRDHPRIVEGVWTMWSEWQPCSVTCGSGVKQRRRECSPPSGDYTGDTLHCPGDRVEQLACDTKKRCPVHGEWGKWTRWSECSATCGETTARYRDCDSPMPEFGGNVCEGEHREVEWCNNVRHCPIDGRWREWSKWSPCSLTCGSGGRKRRYRTCTAPEPRHGGNDCKGDSSEVRTCRSEDRRCPVDGGWTEWDNWKCPPECANGGEGTALRTRRCSNPTPQNGGRHCEGSLIETRPCSETECPVDGTWGNWGAWGECSSSCGERSYKTRKRSCDNPPPSNGGMPCIGDDYRKQICNLDPCPENNASYGSSVVSVGNQGNKVSPCDDDDDDDSYSGDKEGGSGCRDNGSGESDSPPEESEYSSYAFESPDYDD